MAGDANVSNASNDSQVVIVVGASSGMGRATAKRLAMEGMRVVAFARRAVRLAELEDELRANGRTIVTIPGDSARAEDVERLMAATIERYGRIDTLVYATGTNIPKRSLQALSIEDWELLLRTNLTGAFLCTRAVLPAMRRQGSGLIVYLSTAAVQYPDVSGVAYQSSKHGLTGLAAGTRVEEKPNGIRTTIIYPGLCDTEILQKRPTPTPADVVARALIPDDVAEAVRFIVQLDARCHVPELHLLPARV